MAGIEITFRTPHSNHLRDSGYTIEQQAEIYDRQLEDFAKNTRWYLDNYMYMPEYRVSWVDYKHQNITKPYKFVKPRAKKQ
jgi:hypothetical protein